MCALLVYSGVCVQIVLSLRGVKRLIFIFLYQTCEVSACIYPRVCLRGCLMQDKEKVNTQTHISLLKCVAVFSCLLATKLTDYC